MKALEQKQNNTSLKLRDDLQKEQGQSTHAQNMPR
jgi:hypothetical protein